MRADLRAPGSTLSDAASAGGGHKEKHRVLLVAFLLLVSLFLTYYFHIVLSSGVLFSHFFYIPIVLSAFWWKKKGLIVPVFLGLVILLTRHCCLDEGALTYEDYLRSVMFVAAGMVVAVLSERLEKTQGRERQSEIRYRSMFEHMSDGVAVFKPVQDGDEFILVDANRAAAGILGKDLHQWIGRGPLDIFQAGNRLLDNLRRVWKTGNGQTWSEGFHAGTQVRRWEENSAYKLPSGEVVLIFSDKTEQKRAEQKSLQLASIVESAEAAIMSISSDGIIESWNAGAAKIYGHDMDDILGDCILTLVPPDRWGEMLQSIDAVLNQEGRDHYETVHVHRDGSHIDVSLVMSPLYDLSGTIVGASLISRNIARRKSAEKALQKAYESLELKVAERTGELAAVNENLRREIAERERMECALRESSEKIKLFAYFICHDLKSPSIGIYGLARLLRNQYGSLLDDKGKKYCEQILKASQQMGTLVEKINTFISTAESSLDLEALEVADLFDTIREEFSSRLRENRVALTFPEVSAQIRADRIVLLRLLRNLVDNALKYGGEPLKEIRLGYGESDEYHILSVHDDGIGLNDIDQERMFELFQRSSTSRGVEGAGLGLAIVKEAAERHRGRVRVESAAGKGTTFYVFLPKTLD